MRSGGLWAFLSGFGWLCSVLGPLGFAGCCVDSKDVFVGCGVCGLLSLPLFDLVGLFCFGGWLSFPRGFLSSYSPALSTPFFDSFEIGVFLFSESPSYSDQFAGSESLYLCLTYFGDCLFCQYFQGSNALGSSVSSLFSCFWGLEVLEKLIRDTPLLQYWTFHCLRISQITVNYSASLLHYVYLYH